MVRSNLCFRCNLVLVLLKILSFTFPTAHFCTLNQITLQSMAIEWNLDRLWSYAGRFKVWETKFPKFICSSSSCLSEQRFIYLQKKSKFLELFSQSSLLLHSYILSGKSSAFLPFSLYWIDTTSSRGHEVSPSLAGRVYRFRETLKKI